MGFIIGLIKRLIKLGLILAVIVAAIVLIPNLPPYTKFTSIELEPTQARVGPLTPNGDLNNVERLYKDKLLGPEAFQLYNGEVYTSLATGEIVKISPGGHVTFVTKIGGPCTGLTQAHICGRPLGFEIDERTKQLYVADAYLGIWKVDLKTDKKQLLVSPRVAINGRAPGIFNGLALAKNGDIFWTDSSSDYDLKDGAYSMLSDPSGRLFQYNAAKNQSKVLLDNLWMANGIALSPDNQFVLVAESGRLRIQKYYIDGPKKGKSEVFAAGLPGVPDNLRALPDGSGVMVALYTSFDDEHPLISKSMTQTPLARKFLARVQRLVEIPFEFLNKHFPNVIFEDIVYNIGHFKSLSGFLPGLSGLILIDWNGNNMASYYNTDGGVKGISDAIVYNDKLFLGAPDIHNFIGAVPAPPLLKKAFASTKSAPPPKRADTVTEEIPKPKVETKPQQKPAEVKPKVEEKKEAPKITKPAQEPPKQPKPAEPVKTTPKPAEPKATPTPKPTQPPKPAETKPTPKPQVTTPKPEQKETKPATPPKPSEPKTPPPPKPSATITTPPPKQAVPKTVTPKPEIKPNVEKPAAKPTQLPTETKTPTEAKPPKPEQIPIKEEIPSDTVKPNKETLKVIKKGGPAEIPNPNL